MINEFLIITYKWCGEDAQIIQGYVLCNNHIEECKKYTEQFHNAATFSSEDFKILAAKQDDLKIVIIFSNQFLFDPSKCSFILSTNGKQLPFFPKQMDYRLDLKQNYRIKLKNYQNNYNLREQIFFKTFQRQITSGSLIPIIICPKLMLSNIWEYFVEQDCYVSSFEELQESIMLAKRQVQLSNAIIANTLINGCALFQKYIQLKPKYSRKDIESDIMNLAFSDLEHSLSQFKGMPIMVSQNGRFIQQLLIVLKNMISQFFTFIQESIDLLLDNEFDSSELSYVLEGQIENQVGKLTIQLHEFALVEQADFIILFEKIKETIYDIHKDIENFIVDTSFFVNEQMQKVNQMFQDFPALANVRTFQNIQTEASQYIVQELQNYYLLEKSNFWRPEFTDQFQFVKKILIFYLDYNESKIGIPAKTTDFSTSLIRMGMDPKIPIQTIQIIVDENDKDYIKDKDNLIIEQISKIKNGKRVGYKIYLSTKDIIVLQMIKHQVIITSFEYFNQSLWEESELREFNMVFTKGVQFLLETNIEFIKNVCLYELNGEDQQSYQKQSELLVNFSMNMDDQLKKIKKKFFKKLDKAQKGGAPQPTDPSIVAAGAIGSGLGILIVDCLDENISWQKKLQRAGYGTAETTAFAALSMNLPFIGFLIGQTFLFYSVHKVFSNKVLSMQNKLKNMGHLGIKTSMGIGSAVAGQILIPVPVLGALIGSVVGGVGVGLYHKFIVPSTKNSLMGIINRLEQTIQANGQLLYEKQVIKMMKINPTHFFENQPQDLQCSDWLTLVSVHLVNEVSYLYQMQWEEERKKIFEKPDNAEKIERMIKLDVEEDQLEEKLCKWDVCRYYISQQKISTFKYAKQVGIFVTGMISNFKM